MMGLVVLRKLRGPGCAGGLIFHFRFAYFPYSLQELAFSDFNVEELPFLADGVPE